MDTTSICENNYGGGALNRGISGLTLKIIAIISMLIDHLGSTIVYRTIGDGIVYIIMRGIGRMAFPLFCFLLVEGFTYTRNKLKYAGRLALFAVISEVPYDLAFHKKVFELEHNNVFFTLLIGLIVIMLIEGLHSVRGILGKSNSAFKWFVVNLFRCIGFMTIVLGAMALAEYGVKSDYKAAGIAAIVAMYLMRNYRKTAFAAGVILLTLLNGEIEIFALLMLIPLHFYNGTRGKQIKYFFYLFYPVHILILAGICYILGL